MLTRKHYKLIAKALNNVKPYNNETLKTNNYNRECQSLFLDVIDSLSDELIKDNSNFKKERFLKACTE
jgi:hypothetical protein